MGIVRNMESRKDLIMKKITVLFLFLLVLSACTASINETVYVQDGEVRDKDINSINGGIIIGENCKVYGHCRAVNGTIKVGRNSLVSGLQSVNGQIKVEENGMVKGNILAVNGRITLAKGVQINGDVSTVNGDIQLDQAKVAKNIETVNGDIYVQNGSLVEGNIKIKGKSKGMGDKRRIDVYLTEGSQVTGNIETDDETISVKVYVSGESKILGDVINAEIIYQ
mgnify:FL=1